MHKNQLPFSQTVGFCLFVLAGPSLIGKSMSKSKSAFESLVPLMALVGDFAERRFAAPPPPPPAEGVRKERCVDEGVWILEAGTGAPAAAGEAARAAEGVVAEARAGVAKASSAVAPAPAPGVIAVGELGCEETGVPVVRDAGRNVASLEGGVIFDAEVAEEDEEEGCASLEGETSFDAGGERAVVGAAEERGAATIMSALGSAVGAAAVAVTRRGVETTMPSDAAEAAAAGTGSFVVAGAAVGAAGECNGETLGGEIWLRRYSLPASSSKPFSSSSSPSRPSWSANEASSCSRAASSAMGALLCWAFCASISNEMSPASRNSSGSNDPAKGSTPKRSF